MVRTDTEFLDDIILKLETVIQMSTNRDDNTGKWQTSSLEFLRKYGHIDDNKKKCQHSPQFHRNNNDKR